MVKNKNRKESTKNEHQMNFHFLKIKLCKDEKWIINHRPSNSILMNINVLFIFFSYILYVSRRIIYNYVFNYFFSFLKFIAMNSLVLNLYASKTNLSPGKKLLCIFTHSPKQKRSCPCYAAKPKKRCVIRSHRTSNRQGHFGHSNANPKNKQISSKSWCPCFARPCLFLTDLWVVALRSTLTRLLLVSPFRKL